MFRFLQKLFSRRDRLTKLAHGDDREAFISELCDAGALEFSFVVKDEFIDPPERDANSLSAPTEETVELFKYEAEGRVRLPIFSSQRHAQIFARNYRKAYNRVIGIERLSKMSGLALATQTRDCDLVLNDLTDDQYTLTPDDIELYRRHARERGMLGL